MPPPSVPLEPEDPERGAASAPGRRVRFGRFELQPLEGRLLVGGQPATLGGRAFDVLQLLVERAGSLVTRNQLIERAWPDVVVEENNLSVQINALRRLLGPEVIVTVPGRGYRLGLATEPVGAPAAASATEPLIWSPAAPPTPAAGPARPVLRSHLPVGLPTLFGRDQELATLRSLIGEHRLVTLVGAGGVGKSRLAQALLQADAGAPGGVCWIDLHAAASADALPGIVGAALGLMRWPGGDPLAGLVRAAAGLQMLVALDNAETQLDATAALVQALLDGVPGLRLLVTSQAPLRLIAERVLHLGPLAVPGPEVPPAEARGYGAIALFIDRAQAADSRFKLPDAQVALAAELCRRLDGLPLAIELAAARVPVMGLAVLVDSLDDRLRLLTANRNRHAPQRQQTLRDTLQWSYGLLGPLEQAVFRQLAVASDSVSLAVVQGMMTGTSGAPDPWSVLDALDQLAQRSLVDAVNHEAGAAPRYRLLESPRALALEQLVAAGEEAAARQRHAAAVLAEYQQHEQALLAGTIGVDAWRHDGLAMVADGQAARAYAQATGQRALALGLARSVLARAQDPRHLELAGAVNTCVTMLESESGIAPRLACMAWLTVDRWAFGGPERWGPAMQRALALARQMDPADDDERFVRYGVACEAARVCAADGPIDQADALLDEARGLEQPGWPPVRLRMRPRAEAFVAMGRRQPGLALQHLRRVLGLSLQAGDASLATRLNIADMELLAGDAAAAVATGSALVATLEGMRAMELLALARVNLAAAHLRLDQPGPARELLLRAWQAAPNFGPAWPHLDDCQRQVALLAAVQGRHEAAARLTGAVDARRRGDAAGSAAGNTAAAREDTVQRVQAALGAQRLEALRTEGAAEDAAVLMGPALDLTTLKTH